MGSAQKTTFSTLSSWPRPDRRNRNLSNRTGPGEEEVEQLNTAQGILTRYAHRRTIFFFPHEYSALGLVYQRHLFGSVSKYHLETCQLQVHRLLVLSWACPYCLFGTLSQERCHSPVHLCDVAPRGSEPWLLCPVDAPWASSPDCTRTT
jgi:hypothetical protein